MSKPKPGAKKYMTPEARRDQLFNEAWDQAVAHGLKGVTRVSVTEVVGISAPMVNVHFGGIDALRKLLVERAVAERNVDVVADALALGIAVEGASQKLLKEARRLAEAA